MAARWIAATSRPGDLWLRAADDIRTFSALYEEALRTRATPTLQKLVNRANKLMDVYVWAGKAHTKAFYADAILLARRALNVLAKRKDASAGELREGLENIKQALQVALGSAAPLAFTYQGFKVNNPDRLSDTLVYRALNGIDFVKAIFNKRKVSARILDGIAHITVVPEREAIGASAHFNSRTRELVMAADGITESGRFSPSFAGETIIHELGHHLHRNVISGDAAAAWDAPWDELVRLGLVPSLAETRLSPDAREDRSRKLDPLEIVTEYGRTDKFEDFAETFLLYLVAPARLTPTAKFRMQRALSLAGLHGSEVLRVATVA